MTLSEVIHSARARRDEEQKFIEPSDDAAKYFNLLKLRQSKAMYVARSEHEKTITGEETLSAVEKFNKKRDGKILARWQQRQKEWANIQRAISKQLRTKAELLMSSTDEHRVKMEAFDALQQAKPAHERFGYYAWEMDLREGGGRNIAAGHEFSGLEMAVKFKLPEPMMVRHPRRHRALKAEDPAIIAPLTSPSKSANATLPHVISAYDADHLVIYAMDLFQWALESSTQYFQDETVTEMTPEEVEAVFSEHTEYADTTEKLSISLHGGTDVALYCESGKTVYHRMSFTNTGTAALEYMWREVPPVSKADEAACSQVHEVVYVREHGEFSRNHLLSKKRQSIFCLNHKGCALPGETIHTVTAINGNLERQNFIFSQLCRSLSL